MFNGSFLEDNFISEDDIQYNIKIDMSAIFKAKLISYIRQGLKIEKITVPESASNQFNGTPISDNGKYILYTSMPAYSEITDENPPSFDLVISFKKWITRFMYYNLSEEEFNKYKEQNKLAVEVRNKIRKDECWTKEKADLYVHAYYLTWKLSSIIGVDKLNKLTNELNKYLNLENIENMSNEDFNELMEKYQKILEDNPDLFEGLEEILGGY
jgi:hypothetical protein